MQLEQAQAQTTIRPLSLLWLGYRAALPMMVGVAPFGVVFGALAAGAGLNTLEALGMSIFVIAGASQFVATELIGGGTPILVIVFTTWVINLRHLLYSASLANFLKPLGTGWKMLIAYLMIDEVYAPSMQRLRETPMSPQAFRWLFLGGGLNLASVWWTTTIIGVQLGAVLPERTTEFLGFTLPLIFTSIVVPLWLSRPALLASLGAALTAILLNPLPHKLGLIVAAAVGLAVGVWSESRQSAAPITLIETGGETDAAEIENEAQPNLTKEGE